MDEVGEKKGGLDNIQQKLCKIEDSLDKTLGSLQYIREPQPRTESDEAKKADSDGTIPSITHTADRLQKIADNIAGTVSSIRYG